ncbi:MAG: pectin acetylesterase-family hydrolase [Acidimicrobiales bacterium]|nr:pectin acetylesterase-family hydrolase [Acidimicrobiales bacterium]
MLAALSLVAIVAACSGDDDSASADETTTSAAESTTTTTRPPPEWVMHEADEDCECADGSEYTYFSRTDDPEKVVLYFQGGGACFSAETCSFSDGTYKVTTGPADDPTGNPGIFDFDNEANPFAGWSMVFVPYCSGDVHLGDATTEYTDELTVEHNGYVNASQGLDHLVENFPDATDVFVTGSSAGGVPAPLFGGLVSDELPDADVGVLADASGGYSSNPTVNGTIGSLWGVEASIPDWEVTEDIDAAAFGIPDLFHLAGRHDASIRMARYDNAFDEVQRSFVDLAGLEGGTLLDVLDQNEQLVEGNGVDLSTYVAPGENHTILGRDDLYDLTVEGTAFLDWLAELVEGGMPGDVRCTDCGAPAGE